MPTVLTVPSHTSAMTVNQVTTYRTTFAFLINVSMTTLAYSALKTRTVVKTVNQVLS